MVNWMTPLLLVKNYCHYSPDDPSQETLCMLKEEPSMDDPLEIETSTQIQQDSAYQTTINPSSTTTGACWLVICVAEFLTQRFCFQ